MDNAPSPFSVPSLPSPSRSTCGNVTTPTKRVQLGDRESEADDATPRPRSRPRPRSVADETEPNRNPHEKENDNEDLTLGFTLSHLRRVPELALLAARVVRAETRKRDKAERDKAKTQDTTRAHLTSTSASASSRPSGRASTTDSPRKKMKRLFAWAVVKLYEEGSIILWDGEARPLPVPPPPGESSGMWSGTTLGSVDPSVSASTCGPSSALYNLSASASLYSHYHAPCRRKGERGDDDADLGEVSDPGVDEEAYVPLNPRLLARYVREALGVLRRGRHRKDGSEAEVVLACMQRMDGRWARVGLWAVEEALEVLKVV